MYERLGAKISEAFVNGDWAPISLSRGGSRGSWQIMCLFSQEKPSKLRFVLNLLNDFCLGSGFKVNVDKPKAFASKGVTNHRKSKLAAFIGS